MLCLVLAAGVLQATSFQSPIAVAEPDRLALTPRIDGKRDANEWDFFAGQPGSETFLQWEPQRIHAAALARPGYDLLVSLDLKGNGWLIGQDNLEFRVKVEEGRAVLRVRRLDGGQASGPAWTPADELLAMAQTAAGDSDQGRWIELSVADPGLGILPERSGEKVGVRVDLVPSEESFEPFLPRAMTPCRLTMERGSNLPAGLTWKTEMVSRDFTMGGSMRIRLGFNGADALGLRRIDLETTGIDQENGARMSLPFPPFDGKGRAIVDYETRVLQTQTPGYRLLQARIRDVTGNTTFLRTSYRIAPLIEMDWVNPGTLRTDVNEKAHRLVFYIRSNASGRVEGTTTIEVPDGWRLQTGDDKQFIFANGRGSLRRVFDLIAPPNASGLFPLTLTATVGERTFARKVYVRIQ